MAAKTLTRTEGYALQEAHKAVRPSADVLVTRTATYVWCEDAEQWEVTHAGLRVEHCKANARQGWQWDQTSKTFHRCHCTACSR